MQACEVTGAFSLGIQWDEKAVVPQLIVLMGVKRVSRTRILGKLTLLVLKVNNSEKV